MKCSFIVSARERENPPLACCLWSLFLQTEPDFEVIVCDSSRNEIAEIHRGMVDRMRDARFRWIHTPGLYMYPASEVGAAQAHGEYLCFPSDDSYYGPRFLKRMLVETADIIACSMVYDGHGNDYRFVPDEYWGDKTQFLIRRVCFTGFPKPSGRQDADGQLLHDARRAGCSWKHILPAMVVHN